MKVLVACEYSGIVRDAFIARGHDAMSCDLLPTESPGPHFQGDALDIMSWTLSGTDDSVWDLMIAHPPCTHLCVSGNRHYAGTPERAAALEFFGHFLHSPIQRITVENPVGVVSSNFRPPDQYIQPWEFGHGETKKTGLWLKNLPPLMATHLVSGRDDRIHKLPPSKDRGKIRSKTYSGIAEAMAKQWGG